ncbi:MAG: biopolymer transporter ExbD [Deltaproteobacteria bacterium]|nr:biopolymer transporter ExbD [Deltaproteobacteria bacterium]
MAWKTNISHEKVMAEINITPLTDVMLVLLVIFMVTTPLIMSGALNVKLPRAGSAVSGSQQGLTVTVGANGAIELDGRAVAFQDLHSILKERLASGADTSVAVKADSDARHGDVVRVLDIAKQAGALKLGIAVERGDERRNAVR